MLKRVLVLSAILAMIAAVIVLQFEISMAIPYIGIVTTTDLLLSLLIVSIAFTVTTIFAGLIQCG